MSTPAALASLESHELLAEVLAAHHTFKQVGSIFEERPPDEETGALLVAAFVAGRAPPWLAAYLLGCLRARDAYDVVRGILESNARQGAESYAGVALARIGGRAAHADLLRLMRDAVLRSSREGALHGLAELGDLTDVPSVLAAARDGLVRQTRAGSTVARLGTTSAELVEWLESTDEVLRNVALEAAIVRSQERGWRDVALSRAVRTALERGNLKVAPHVRRTLDMLP